MRAASPTFGYGDLDLVELDEQTPLQPARNQGRSSGQRLLPPLVAAGCACLMVAAVAYRDAIPRNEGGTTLRGVTTKKPHVVLTVLDDAGFDDLWSSSDLAAPHLTALRDEGVELTSHYVASECTPTRGALLTGLHPSSLGLQRGVISQTSRWGLDPSVKTLADVFRDHGYTTALAGKWHLGHSNSVYLPERRGFASVYGFLGGFVDPYTHYAEAPPICESDASDCVVDWSSPSRTYAADAVTHEAKRLISSTSEKPLFLYYALPTPHEPLLEPPSPQYDDRLQGRRRIFGAIAAHQDAKVGSVVKSLKDNALWPSTLFIVLADNGAAAAGGSNWPLRGAKGGVWEGGVRTRAAHLFRRISTKCSSTSVPPTTCPWCMPRRRRRSRELAEHSRARTPIFSRFSACGAPITRESARQRLHHTTRSACARPARAPRPSPRRPTPAGSGV